MSMTFSPAGNASYCVSNNLMIVDQVKCSCVHENGDGLEDCFVCNGSGNWTCASTPFEMNLANGNARTLLSALGFDPESYGGVCVSEMRDAIVSMETQVGTELIVRSDNHEGNVFTCGIPKDRAENYLRNLKEMCDEADRRKVKTIEWN